MTNTDLQVQTRWPLRRRKRRSIGYFQFRAFRRTHGSWRACPCAGSLLQERQEELTHTLTECTLNVKVLHGGGVRLDEFFAGQDLVAHEDVKDMVCGGGVRDHYLLQDASRRIHGRLPKFGGVHLAQSFVALNLNAFHVLFSFGNGLSFCGGAFLLGVEFLFPHLGHDRVFFRVRICVLAGFTGLHFVQRRLGNIEIPFLNNQREITEEERQNKRADVRAVHISIGHNDNAVITQARHVKFVADGRPQRYDQRPYFFGRKHLVQPRALHVQNFTAQGQNGLEFSVPPHLTGSPCAIALYQKQFRFRRVFGLAVRELARKRHAVQSAFAQYGLARGLGGFTRFLREQCFADDLGRISRIFL